MGKKSENPQINFRVEPATMEVLEAAIYARRLRGPQELLGPLIEKFAQQLATEPGVTTAMRARQESDSHATGKLKQIGQKRSSKSDVS